MRKFFWLHIKKVAGTSIRKALDDVYVQTNRFQPTAFIALPKEQWNDNLNNFRVPLGEYDFRRMLFAKRFLYSQDEFDEMFKFVFVRNPYARAVSAWKYLISSNTRWKYLKKIIPQKKCFELFLKQLPYHWREKRNRHIFTHTAPMYSDIIDKEGKLLVNHIGKHENIQKDFDDICTQIGINTRTIPKLNPTNDKIQHYSKYYTRKSKELIYTLYKDDIEFFRYSFDRK